MYRCVHANDLLEKNKKKNILSEPEKSLFFYLILFPTQARVHQELDAIFGDSDRQCTFSDTMEMKYLERVILETLRLFPPVPIIARRLNEDVKLGTVIQTQHILLQKTKNLISNHRIYLNLFMCFSYEQLRDSERRHDSDCASGDASFGGVLPESRELQSG